MIHNLPVIRLIHAVDLHGLRLVHQVEQRRECIAKAEAATAAMADVEYPLQFRVERTLVVELRVAPGYRLALRGLETALSLN